MKKIHLLAILAILIALLVPVTVAAAGTFYCSTSVTTGGTGTLTDPWACSDATQLDSVINDQVCDIYNGGDLYQIFPGSYRLHVVTWYAIDDCRVTATYDYAGYPPSTGPDLPTPYLVGAAAVVGAGLIAAGFIIIRRRRLAEV
jgi:hypothetical protein